MIRFITFVPLMIWISSLFAQQSGQEYLSEVRFFPNKGQRNDGCEVYAKTGQTLFRMYEGKYLLSFVDRLMYDSIREMGHSGFEMYSKERMLKGQNIAVNFLGSNKMAETQWVESFDEYYNFLRKADAGLVNIHPAKKVIKKEIYEGIDLQCYSVGTMIKMDWIVKPFANARVVRLEYEGVSQLKVNELGHLLIKHEMGEYFEFKCIAYQKNGRQQKEVRCNYLVNGNEVTFQLSDYDHSKELVIDPVLVFSTYSGSQGDNFGFCATNDAEGNLYAVGIVNGLDGAYPVTAGAFQLNFGGCGKSFCDYPADISISKYATDGKTLLYASYLGGNRYEFPHSINVHSDNSLLILGSTNSINFPVTVGAFQNAYEGGGSDLFVTKISPDGTGIQACTYLGGSGNDGENAHELIFFHNDYYRGDILSADNRIYIGCYTGSDDMPVSGNAYQSKFGGMQDGYLAWLSLGLDTLIYGTYYGGKKEDAVYAIRLNKSKTKIYVSGGAGSPDLPMSGNGYVSVYESGEADGYIASFNTTSGKLVESTFLGIAFMDQIFMMDIDQQDRINVFGLTFGPVMKTPKQYGFDARGHFIARFNTSLNKQEFITTIGSISYPSPHLSPSAFMIDQCNNIYLSAWGSGVWYSGGYSSGSTMDLPVTANAVQSTTDSNDFYLMVLSEDAEKLIFASFMGGNQTADHIDGGMSRFDQDGVVYQSVCASCPDDGQGYISDFPTDKNALYNANLSYRCSNASFKLDFRVVSRVKSQFVAAPPVGCSPFKTTFTNQSTLGKYDWDFGDGNRSTETNPEHVFKKPGIYTVKLYVGNPQSCNSTDSSEIMVKVERGLEYDFKENLCDKTITIHSLNGGSVLATFNDGTRDSGVFIKKTFPEKGEQEVWIRNTSPICPDSAKHLVEISDFSIDSVFIPNVFTPNEDGVNECFFIDNIANNCIEGFSLQIYNRWGERVFETSEKAHCWKGETGDQNQLLPAGAYFTLVKLRTSEQKNYSFSGTVTLIR